MSSGELRHSRQRPSAGDLPVKDLSSRAGGVGDSAISTVREVRTDHLSVRGAELTADQEFSPVQQRLMEFVSERIAPGRTNYSVSKLVGDASARQSFRLVTEDKSFIIAAYPEPFVIKDFTYHQVYTLFRGIGLIVPEIYDADEVRGIVMQQDLGDESLQKRLLSVPTSEWGPLVRKAIDVIARISSDRTKHFDPELHSCRLAF